MKLLVLLAAAFAALPGAGIAICSGSPCINSPQVPASLNGSAITQARGWLGQPSSPGAVPGGAGPGAPVFAAEGEGGEEHAALHPAAGAPPGTYAASAGGGVPSPCKKGSASKKKKGKGCSRGFLGRICRLFRRC